MKRLLSLTMLFVFTIGCTSCNLPTVPEEMPKIESTEVQIIPTDTVAPSATADLPAEEPNPTDTAVPEIVHIINPGFGDGKAQTVHDQESDKTADEKRAYGGDEFNSGRFERPFLAKDMEYIPAVDIIRADLYRDEDTMWAYATIEVINMAENGGEEIHYGIEIDENLDGRGNTFILVSSPQDTKWTTDGVQVWQDINHSIGSSSPMKPDAGGGADGYETLIFDAGIGEDADLAWVRKSDESENAIEIAFKLNLIPKTEDATLFLWGAWAFAGDPHLDWFDHHDTLTLEEAGSPLKENENYPLMDFEGADNTCRGLSGMDPIGSLPGMCPYTPPPANDQTTQRCVPRICCTSVASACTLHWNPVTCQCE
jgi:hypothetical protein